MGVGYLSFLVVVLSLACTNGIIVNPTSDLVGSQFKSFLLNSKVLPKSTSDPQVFIPDGLRSHFYNVGQRKPDHMFVVGGILHKQVQVVDRSVVGTPHDVYTWTSDNGKEVQVFLNNMLARTTLSEIRIHFSDTLPFYTGAFGGVLEVSAVSPLTNTHNSTHELV